MRQLKNIFIYTLVLAFIYIGAGIPITSYCCQQKQEMKMSCCKGGCCKDHQCQKTTILKVDNFEQPSASISVTPILNLVADVFSPYSYAPSLTEITVRGNHGYPPGPDSSRHYLSMFCVLLI